MIDDGPVPPEKRPPPSSALGDGHYRSVRLCPSCGRRLFLVTNTWRLADGTIRRLRKCSMCGHAANSSEVFD